MSGFGQALRQAREEQHISLLQAEQALKIKSSYLQALEDERLELLPSPVYVRGFLRQYARLLGLNPDGILASYRQLAGAEPVVALPSAQFKRVPRVAVTTPVVAGAIALLALSAFLFYVYRQVSTFRHELALNRPTPSTTYVPSTQNSPIPSPSTAPSPSPSPIPTSGITVSVHVDAYTWLELVINGGSPTYDASYPAGTTLTVHASHDVYVDSGKAADTFLTINGKYLGAMGSAVQPIGQDYLASQYPYTNPTP